MIYTYIHPYFFRPVDSPTYRQYQQQAGLLTSHARISRGSKGVPGRGVGTSVNMRIRTCKELRVKHDQDRCYLRPPFLGTPLVPSGRMPTSHPVHQPARGPGQPAGPAGQASRPGSWIEQFPDHPNP